MLSSSPTSCARGCMARTTFAPAYAMSDLGTKKEIPDQQDRANLQVASRNRNVYLQLVNAKVIHWCTSTDIASSSLGKHGYQRHYSAECLCYHCTTIMFPQLLIWIIVASTICCVSVRQYQDPARQSMLNPAAYWLL